MPACCMWAQPPHLPAKAWFTQLGIYSGSSSTPQQPGSSGATSSPRPVPLGSDPLSSCCWLLCPGVSDSAHSKSTSTWVNFSWIPTSGPAWLRVSPLLSDRQCCAHAHHVRPPEWVQLNMGQVFIDPEDTVADILAPTSPGLVYPKSSPTPARLFPGSSCLAFWGPTSFTFWSVRGIRVVRLNYVEDRQIRMP